MNRFDPNQRVGVDIGGANLKFAAASGEALSRSFPMWRQPETLADTLTADLRHHYPACRRLAVTMTGELADCFLDRAEGVRHIVHQVVEASRRRSLADPLFYSVTGSFCDSEEACDSVDRVAAANWHALASLVAATIEPDAILIDVGSTTTDVIPLAGGRVATQAMTDFDRLRDGALVYIGCRRTPVCALVRHLQFRGKAIPVMNELFATIDDALVLLGLRAANAADVDSADGRPCTIELSANRMARMIGLDHRDVSVNEAGDLAAQVIGEARERVAKCLGPYVDDPRPWVLSGHGETLVQPTSERRLVRLSERLGAATSRCAPAYAVAVLSDPHHANAAVVSCAGS